MITTTEQCETSSDGRSPLARLKPAQREAIPLLAQGIAITQIAEQINVGRVSIYRWLKDEEFQAALAQAQDRAVAEIDQESEAFARAMKIPLLSPAGIRARLELKDHLLLADLRDRDGNRASLIKRLEDSIIQASDYFDKLPADEVANDLFQQRDEVYCQSVLAAVVGLLKDLPGADRLMSGFQSELDGIDRKAGLA